MFQSDSLFTFIYESEAILKKLIILSSSIVLAACGGGSAAPGATTPATSVPLSISGVAATGAAISGGAISVQCATGTGTATTNKDGSYTVTISNGVAPCLIKVSATDALGSTTNLFSAVESGQTTANITPLTQMIVAAALGGDPATAFAAGVSGTTTTNLSSTALSAAVTKIQQVATNLGLDLAGADPLKATLQAATDNAAGDSQDKVIDGLMAALRSSNISIATLTTAVAGNPTTSTAITDAVKSKADTNAPLTTSSLGNCPVARTGAYLYASPGDTQLNRVFINFDSVNATTAGAKNIPALQGFDYTNNMAFTVTPDSTAHCAYQFQLIGAPAPINVRVAAGGVAAFSINGSPTSTFPNATPIAIDGLTSAAGLVIPVQKQWTNADLANAEIYTMHFSKMKSAAGLGVNSDGVRMNFYAKFVFDATGTAATAYPCSAPGTCSSTAMNTFTVSAPDAVDGTFAVTSVLDPTVTQVALYVAPSGDVVGMGVNKTASAYLYDNFTVFSKRVSTLPTRAVSDTYSVLNWTIINNAGAGLSQKSSLNAFTVSAVTGDSFTRTWDTNTDTITINSPMAGMITRVDPTGTLKPFYGFTGQGWSIYASSAPGGGSDSLATLRGNNFLGFSISQ